MGNWDVESGDRADLLRTMLDEPKPESRGQSAGDELRNISKQYSDCSSSPSRTYYSDDNYSNNAAPLKRIEQNNLLASGGTVTLRGHLIRSNPNSQKGAYLNYLRSSVEGDAIVEHIETGKKLIGLFQDGLLIKGTATWPDGSYQEGSFSNGWLVDGKKNTPYRDEPIRVTRDKPGYFRSEEVYDTGQTFKKGVFSITNGEMVEGKEYRSDGSLAKEGTYSEASGELIKGRLHDEQGNITNVNNFLKEPKTYLKAQFTESMHNLQSFLKQKAQDLISPDSNPSEKSSTRSADNDDPAP